MSSFSPSRSDPSRIAPFLTNVVTHHGQLTLIPPQNAGRIRKGGKKALLERARTERRRDDEPRFNTAAPASPRAANRRANHAERSPRAPPAVPQRFSRDTMIPDYPPPSFQEAMMTPPFIPPSAVDVQETQAQAPAEPANENPPPVQEPRHAELHISTSSPSINTPASASPSTAGATPTPPSSSHSHSHSSPLTLDTPTTETTPDASPSHDDSPHSQLASSDTASEDSSIELVSLDTDAYDLSQRLAGPLRCRAARIHRRQHPSHSHSHSHKDGMQTPRHVAHLSIDVDDAQAQERGRCSRCGSPTPEDCTEILPDEVDVSPLPTSYSPPSSPKSSKWKRLFVPTSSASGHNSNKDKEKDAGDQVPMTPMSPSPMISSPKSSRFGFLPGALASTLTLSSPSSFSSATSSSPSPSKSSSFPSKPSPSKPFASGQRREREKDKEPSVMRRIFSPKGKDKDRDAQRSVGGGMGGVNPRDSVDWEFIDKEVPSVDEDEVGTEEHAHQERGGSPVETSSSTSHSEPTASRRNTREQRETHPHSHSPSHPSRAPPPQPELRDRDTQTPEHTSIAAAFINRPVRHSPLALNPFPMFSASNANSSVVSLPLQPHTASSLSNSHNSANGQLGLGSGQPGLGAGGTSSPLARRQTLSTSHASPSVVWLPLITSEDGSVTVAGSPIVSSAMPSPVFGSPSLQRMPMPPRSPVHARNPSAPSIGHNSQPGRPPPHVVTSPLAFSITPTYDYDYEPDEPCPSPTFTESPASAHQDSPQDLPSSPSFSDTRSTADVRDREMRDVRRSAPPPLRSPASTSTLASTTTTTTTYDYDYDSGTPSSPTTPTRHYHGRPLPQTPGPAGPFERAGHTPLFRPAFLPGVVLGGGGQLAPPADSGPYEHEHEYPQMDRDREMSDLDVYAAQVVDSDDRDGGGRRYEDLLRIAEMAGPAVSPSPHTHSLDSPNRHPRPRREGEENKERGGEEEEGLKLPPSGRVKLERRRVTKDGRVKLKLTLMEVVVDKCSICLSQFKEAEVACLGTRCPHAFHEYCLKRWIATRRSCPLCRAEI